MISTKSAINFIVFLSNNNSKQNFFIEPGLVSLGSSNILNTQQSNINTFCLFSNLEFYKNWSFLKFKISNNLEMQKDHIITYLFDNQTQAINNDFVNNFKFKDVTNQLKFDTSIKRKKFNFGMSINLWYNNLYLDEIITSKKNLLFNLNYKYIIDKKNSLNLLYNEDIKAPTINYLFEKNVVNSYRNIISNQRNLDYVKSRDIRLTYNLSDLFHTFYFNVGTGFSSMNKAYYYINQISAELIYNKAILLDYGNNKMYFDFSVHKLIPFIKTTVKLNSAFSTFSSYNFINNSELRKLKSSTINSELFLYTGFKAKVNFQEKINSESNFYKVNDENNTSLTQIKNEFNITYKISSLINFKMEFQTFIPDRNKKSTFNFLNFEINYKFEKYNIDMYLKGQNLLNVKKFEDVFISDFSTSAYTYNLQERYIVLGMNYKIF